MTALALTALLLSSVIASLRIGAAAWLLLAVAIAVWLFVPHTLQGPTLMRLWSGQGVHVGDLLTIPAVGIPLGFAFSAQQRRR